jgi:quercetin dioxygenase-like cupin family protein
MRRRLLACVLLGLVVPLGLLAAPSVPAAQEATPAGAAGTITAETLGSVPSLDTPGMTLLLLRVTLGPGAVVPPHVHPGQLVVVVESGTVAYTLLGEEAAVLRAGPGTPTAVEAVEPQTEVLFGPGEWWIEVPDLTHTARNPGDAPAVVLVSGLVATDEPFLQPMEMAMATPAA